MFRRGRQLKWIGVTGFLMIQQYVSGHETKGRFDLDIWTEALFATALVGLAPIIILTVVPLGSGDIQKQKPMLRVFLSFAAGGLLGDAFLHLLPHSMPTHGHHHHHGHGHHHHDRSDGGAHDDDHHHHRGHDHHHHDAVGHTHSIADLAPWLWTLAGIVAFLMLEKFVRSHSTHFHSHHHDDDETVAAETVVTSPVSERAATLRSRKKKAPASTKPKTPRATIDGIAAAGYLNLAADFSHNFTDGLAIGATFLQGSGWQTTLAMLLHEVPHEIGDFAILIQSGFTRKQAMLSQVWTAIGAMIGTVIGLLMEGAGEEKAAWITPFTGGGFIYIACTSVFPEILQDNSLRQSIKELVAMTAGIALMVLIALYE